MERLVTLTWVLVLLLLYGRGGEALTVSSNATGNFVTGADILLPISYSTTKSPTVTWLISSTVTATWTPTGNTVLYPDRMSLYDNGSLHINQTTLTDQGLYNVTVSVIGDLLGVRSFTVKFYDKVQNVTVTQSPAEVIEGSATASLTCSSSIGQGKVMWGWDGGPLNFSYGFSFLDENKTLQINQPNKTQNGNYTCTITNPVSSDWGTRSLVVFPAASSSGSLSPGAIAGIVIGSVFGALLLIALIVLLVCWGRHKKGAKEKTPSGPKHKDVLRTVSGTTLSPDDPAYFTQNNILYRNSSISMGSYIMGPGTLSQNVQNTQNKGRARWETTTQSSNESTSRNTSPVNTSEYSTPNRPRNMKHATQV
ncbi:hepatocyte cell adhesion molecule-like isoform X2 [Xenopus laevis]|uniref:Hepatocyte cell adhesion molecule-like isoform X1 n=1 Tax=Xenopus laevis TaxID=8355 RepID=A0A8J1LDL7_XENLA|nr:hepatocyte cell adhesion molecule-like isoform X1 [Xenopus laevis]XP_041427632.1 hepatocyte cell adhesion molecule-like isoform X2 [Xenopus laevis]